MNDISMGFKHTMLQRLQNYDVYPSKSTASSNGSESGEEQTPQPAHVTDFSISRILGDEAHNKGGKPVKSPTISVKTNLSAPCTPTPFTTDILDLSKSSPAAEQKSPIAAPRQPAYPTPTYQGFHSDFLAAAAAANATKFYAQFFPQMCAPYALPNFSVPTAVPYQKQRYFAPYIINSNSTHPNQPTQSANSRLPTLTHASSIPLSHPSSKNICTRASCTDCLDFYKQYPLYKSTLPSVPTSPASSTSSTCHSSYSANYLKTKSSTELLLKSSTIALTTVANFNLTSKTTKLCANSPSSVTALNAEEISYKCCICDKVFGCSQTLQAHEKTHKSPRYECTDCGKGFSQLRNYKYHLSVHRGTKEFAAECPECGKTFNDKGYLSSHMKIHRNKKEYECPYCPKSFNQRVAFNMHVRIHTGVKPHKCAECGKRFSRKMLLKQHMRTHSGEKPYQCSVCGKSFADRSNMTLHHRLHSGIKPFNCPICPKAFTKKHHLKTHLNYHTGCKPYVCPHPNCNQAFTQSSNMRTHAKKCQYRPLQLPYPVAASATSSISNVTSTASSMALPTPAAAAASLTPIVSRLSIPAPPIVSGIATTAAGFSSVVSSSSSSSTTASSHIPNLSTALSAGMRMLSAASAAGTVTLASNGTTSGGHNAVAQQPLLLFPPAQQPLMGTLRPF
ncbi:zinc finger protein 629 [Zeugodacus cucurbitae]|uniref:zinc finger protein 629 n=1 Tax=Zeugodacus cucurbitae TaxID=28588 RepID=UPI0023D92A42|nr:zinc finger protein 629 [Zeugodacus cucurbitae]